MNEKGRKTTNALFFVVALSLLMYLCVGECMVVCVIVCVILCVSVYIGIYMYYCVLSSLPIHRHMPIRKKNDKILHFIQVIHTEKNYISFEAELHYCCR